MGLSLTERTRVHKYQGKDQSDQVLRNGQRDQSVGVRRDKGIVLKMRGLKASMRGVRPRRNCQPWLGVVEPCTTGLNSYQKVGYIN